MERLDLLKRLTIKTSSTNFVAKYDQWLTKNSRGRLVRPADNFYLLVRELWTLTSSKMKKHMMDSFMVNYYLKVLCGGCVNSDLSGLLCFWPFRVFQWPVCCETNWVENNTNYQPNRVTVSVRSWRQPVKTDHMCWYNHFSCAPVINQSFNVKNFVSYNLLYCISSSSLPQTFMWILIIVVLNWWY